MSGSPSHGLTAPAAASTRARRPAHRASSGGGMARNGKPLDHRPGELRIRVLGVLLRSKAADPAYIQDQLDVADPTTVRITLGRMEGDGHAERTEQGWRATRKGRAYAAKVVGWLSP